MEKDEIPQIVRPNRRRTESRWARFWRRRRMNSIRNSSDQAVYTALALLAIVALLGLIVFFGMRDAEFGAGRPSALDGLTQP